MEAAAPGGGEDIQFSQTDQQVEGNGGQGSAEGPLSGSQVGWEQVTRPENPDGGGTNGTASRVFPFPRGLPQLSPGTPFLHYGQRQRRRRYQLRPLVQGGVVV